MIGHLRGRLLHKNPPYLLLDVGGVGYELEAPMTTFYDLPDAAAEVSLFVHLVVREDAQLLFGFSDAPQREVFRALLRVTGVGPRVALAILSTLSAGDFTACIRNADAPALTRVPGIGAKTAERIIFDLRERVDALPTGGGAEAARAPSAAQDAVGALLALGYKPADASRAVRAAQEAAADGESVAREELIRLALRQLSK